MTVLRTVFRDETREGYHLDSGAVMLTAEKLSENGQVPPYGYLAGIEIRLTERIPNQDSSRPHYVKVSLEIDGLPVEGFELWSQLEPVV